MSLDPIVPETAVIRVLRASGPYLEGDTITIAYVDPAVARLEPHVVRPDTARSRVPVPEIMPAVVLRSSAHLQAGVEYILSFNDPRLARIHSQAASIQGRADLEAAEHVAVEIQIHDASPAVGGAPSTISLCSGWATERAHQCIAVIDKLFTIDKLGCYRHVFATRLLLATDIAGPEQTLVELAPTYAEFRKLMLDTLGAPLLEAYVSGFEVTPEWSARLEDPRSSALLGALRGTADIQDAIGRAEFQKLRTTPSLYAWTPAFIAAESHERPLTDALEHYRSAAIEVFTEIAALSDASRGEELARNHSTLDDRLWKLAGLLYDARVSSAA